MSLRYRNSGKVAMPKKVILLLTLLPWLIFSYAKPAQAQSIIPNSDGTGTLVTPNGNRFNINGGTLSGDGKNLFHSFQEFGLDANQIANFLSDPNIQNILSRINGGNASIINGLIEVTGGNSNLFLMNPAGIIFGPNASLNVPADFTATTSTGIGFDGGWFNAFGPNNYINLVGNPNAFQFSTAEPGTIVNAGDLAVEAGQNLSLIGGTVVNTGTMEASGGNITVTAVPGTSVVHISQEGQILSLEVQAPTDSEGNILPFTAMDLPTLLTGAAANVNTGLSVTPTGEVQLTDSGTTIPTAPGTSIVSGTVDASSIGAAALGGTINIFGDTIGLIEGDIDASGSNGGGTVLIGGGFQGNGTIPRATVTVIDENTDIAANATDSGNGGTVVAWSDDTTLFYGNITARGGNSGGDGGLVETSGVKFLDATGTVDASAPTGVAGTWLLDPNDITIQDSGTDTNVFSVVPGDFTTTDDNAIITTATIEDALNAGTNVTITTGAAGANTQEGNITVADNIEKTAGGSTSLSLRATNSIFLDSNVQISSTSPTGQLNITLDASGGTIDFASGSGIDTNGALTLNAPTEGIDLGTLNVGGNFTVIAGGDITGSEDIEVGATTILDSASPNIILNSPGNDFSSVLIQQGQNVTLTDINTLLLVTPPALAGDLILTMGTGINLGQLNIGGDLVVNSPGTTTFTGTINANSVTTDNGGTTQINTTSVTTTGGQTYNDAVILLGQDTVLDGNSITFNSTLDASAPGGASLTVNSNNNSATSFNGIVGGNNPLNNLTTNSDGTTQINAASLTTTGAQAYNDLVEVQTDTALTSQQGVLNFGNNLSVGSNSLTLNSNNAINFAANAAVSATDGELLLQPINPDRNINLSSGSGTELVITNLNTVNGFAQITIGSEISTGTLTITDAQTFFDPIVLRAADIVVNELITGQDNASITIQGAGTTTTLNADIISNGNEITIEDNVSLGNNVNLSSSGANITIDGSIDGNQDLAIDAASAEVSLSGAIGSQNSLANLSVTGTQINLAGGTVITTGNQDFTGNLTLSNNTNFSADNNFTAENISSQGMDVGINASQITTGDIDTSNLEGSGSNIDLNSSQGAIATGNLNSSGNLGAGNITLTAPSDIQVSSIDARSSGGAGGVVNLTTSTLVRVTGTLADDPAVSIDTTGASGGDAITIQYDGEANIPEEERIPFIVGDATENGTAEAIVSSQTAIEPVQSFTFTETVGNISIISVDEPPETSPETPSETIPPTSVTPPESAPPNEQEVFLRVAQIDPDPTDSANQPLPQIQDVAFTAQIEKIFISNTSQVKAILSNIEQATATKPAVIYVSFTPAGYEPENLEEDFARREAGSTQEYQQRLRVKLNKLTPLTIAPPPNSTDQLDILIISNQGSPVRITVPVSRGEVIATASEFYQLVSNNEDGYLPYAQKLYSWLIAPLEAELEKQEIQNLLFIMPEALRLLPISAFYDAKTDQFLVEKYSSGFAPSLNLNNNNYRNIRDLKLLAMGAAKFEDPLALGPLPGVELELPRIKRIWQDDELIYINEDFNLETIKSQRGKYGIIHFATHGEFVPGEEGDSYIQLYDRRLGIDQIRELGFNDPLVELLVLSACETAYGDANVELGFAGLAVKSGVKTVLASLWQVSDTGTVALMNAFYEQLTSQETKAEALRQAQLQLLNKTIIKEGNEIITPRGNITLLPESFQFQEDLSHPYYWAPFTLIGNPW